MISIHDTRTLEFVKLRISNLITVMVKTGLVTGGSERIAVCYCTYGILSGYRVEYRSTQGIVICRLYWCNAKGQYIYMYIYILIL